MQDKGHQSQVMQVSKVQHLPDIFHGIIQELLQITVHQFFLLLSDGQTYSTCLTKQLNNLSSFSLFFNRTNMVHYLAFAIVCALLGAAQQFGALFSICSCMWSTAGFCLLAYPSKPTLPFCGNILVDLAANLMKHFRNYFYFL